MSGRELLDRMPLEYRAQIEAEVSQVWEMMRVERVAAIKYKAERDALKVHAEELAAALEEIGGRLMAHPAYADLTEAEEIVEGGDTAEFSYLVRVARAALAKHERFTL